MAMGRLSLSFNIDPSGRYMYVCNQRSDAVTTLVWETARLEVREWYTRTAVLGDPLP